MIWFSRKRRAELAHRAEEARLETEKARNRLHKAREEVVKPLRRAAEQNQFADIIRQSLLSGGHR
jgi:hypothetical protein